MSAECTMTKVRHLHFGDIDKKKYRHYKNNLEPFIVTDWQDHFPSLINFSENDAEILCSYVGTSPAECSTVHNENVNRTLYFYQKEGADNGSLKLATKGGMDILDDPAMLEKELLELQVSAIKNTVVQSQAPSHQAHRLDDLFGYGREEPREFSVKQTCCLNYLPLTLSEAREILLCRAKNADRATLPPSRWDQLICDGGALSMKALISSNEDLMDSLCLEKLFFEENDSSGNNRADPHFSYVPLSHPLILDAHCYVAWINLAEKGGGTRTHTNIMSSHGYHLLLKGKKKWRLVHSLDRHLITNPSDGTLPDLFNIDPVEFPLARYARMYDFVQSAGEAVFIPSDALLSEISLEPSISISISFMDNSCAAMREKQKRDHSIIVSKSNLEAYDRLSPLTTVDLILFTENVYTRVGDQTHLSKEKQQDVYLLRSLTEFEQIEYPCSELGARIELEALQNCFSLLGEVLLQNGDPHYVIGIPKGYIVSRGDRRLLLYYNVKPESMEVIKNALTTYRRKLRNFIHWYECVEVTLPAITPFRFTCSQFGKIPNYAPLSVLLGQAWPFERRLLCNGTVSLGRIILDKVHHPLGFIRPGSVWHYSRFFTFGSSYGNHATEGVASESEPELDNPSFKLSFLGGNLEENPDKGWCRTFLFYCCPLLEQPILMHPVIEDASLIKGEELIRMSTSPLPNEQNTIEEKLELCPRIIEFKWDVDMLEKYGMVGLIHLGEKDQTTSIVRDTIVNDSSFVDFLHFVAGHDLQGNVAVEETVEVVMAAVLYFLCRPSVVGYACGNAATRDVDYSVHLKPLERNIPSPTTPEEDLKTDDEKSTWDTVCLTATAASALLVYEEDSLTAELVTRLCNWLCDIQMDRKHATPDDADTLKRFISEMSENGSVEEKAAVTEVLRIKKIARRTPPRSPVENTFQQCIDVFLARHKVNSEKLDILEQLCIDMKTV
ncbi:hypothetical protein ADEAN_000423400 [Angomonas deanei]|uniref:JmjC domain-containing protein n=1 Tax=Angomonas deanei TaxID=59799 RepID=A0A7G2CCM3_9TRYP|nr:hypothetical protein ADEAN_000423400 [Angomonas deanei]